jgi:ferritin
MLNEKIEAALNDQLNFEFYSSYIYLSMSAYFESIDLKGCARWMRAQTQEEMLHAMKFFDFIAERGGRVILKPIGSPSTQWGSPLKAFENALFHEGVVTERINYLMDIAQQEKDHATQIFLQWFISEQVEEEASVNSVVQRLKLAGDNPGHLFMLDRDLSARVFTMPANTGADAK